MSEKGTIVGQPARQPDAVRDFGSEPLPTDIQENPWDVPAGTGGFSPADLVTGESPDSGDGSD